MWSTSAKDSYNRRNSSTCVATVGKYFTSRQASSQLTRSLDGNAFTRAFTLDHDTTFTDDPEAYGLHQHMTVLIEIETFGTSWHPYVALLNKSCFESSLSICRAHQRLRYGKNAYAMPMEVAKCSKNFIA